MLEEPKEPISFQASWYFLPHGPVTKDTSKKIPCLRWGHSATVFNKAFYVYGGSGLVKTAEQWQSIYKLDLESWDWSRLEPKNVPPKSLDSHSCLQYNDNLYIFGGNNQEGSQNTLFEYSLKFNTWRTVETRGVPPSPREGQCSVLFKKKYMVIYGGWSSEESFNECHILDLEEMTWLAIDKEIGVRPSSRESQSCCIIKDEIYLFGGQGNNITKDGHNYENFFNDLYRVKLNVTEGNKVIIEWEELFADSVIPSKRASHACCIYKDRYMFIIAGEGYVEGFEERLNQSIKNKQTSKDSEEDEEYLCHPKNDVWYYDTVANKWHKLELQKEAEFSPRFVHKADIFGDFIIVFGGLRNYHNAAGDVSVLSMFGADPFETAKGQLELMVVPKPLDKMELEHHHVREISGPKEKMPALKSKKTQKKNESDDKKNLPQVNVFEPKLQAAPRATMMERKVAKAMVDHTAHKLEKTVVSLAFAHQMASLITSPIAAFGLLVDNALINQAKQLRISYLKFNNNGPGGGNDSASKGTKIKKKGGKAQDEDDGPNILNPYLLIDDNGKGWKFADFLDILLSFDIDTPESIIPADPTEENYVEDDERKKRIHEYAFNLKVGSFKLGKTMIFATRLDDEISVGLLSVDKQYNASVHSSQVYYSSWKKSTGEFITSYGLKYKNIILKAIAPFMSEDEFLKSLDKTSTRVIILDLTPISVATGSGGNAENTELVQKRRGQEAATDVRIRAFGKDLKRVYNKLPNMLIEVSLRTYLSYFFLDGSKAGLEIKLNEATVIYESVKENMELKRGRYEIVKMQQDGLFEGTLMCFKRNKETGDKRDSRKGKFGS